MQGDPRPPSLLTYLDAGRTLFRLEITKIPRQTPGGGATFSAFLKIGNSGPVASLTSAKITTDAGVPVKQVFLMQQRDEYRLHADQIWPINNVDIDQRWQETVARYSNAAARKAWGNGPLLLKDQIDGSGKLLRFQSLFYCIFRDVFFHPPCPECGCDLTLCEDDQLLIESELSAYATSVRRYLYCSECFQHSGQTVFYTFKRESSDPPHLKDLLQLIGDFGKRVLNAADAGRFPCTACPEKSECYGPDNRVVKRIVPYGFYPFYGLIFEAATLHAFDFLMLLSGASPDDLRHRLLQERKLGRLSLLDAFCDQQTGPPSCLFPPDHPKRFLEILYLKLSFLGELVEMVSSGSDTPAGFEAPFTVDDVWVTLPDHSLRLPIFWNFKLQIVSIGAHAGSSGRLSKYPPSYSRHLLGITWFYVLLVNARQSIETVRAEIEDVITSPSGSGHDFSVAGQLDSRPVLAPTNIFWNPEAGAMDAGWLKFWEKAVDLGGEMLAADVDQAVGGSENRFAFSLQSLKKEIADVMLGRTDLRAPRQDTAHDHAISALLLRLQDKWRAELEIDTDSRDPDQTIAMPLSEKAVRESDRPAFDREQGSPTVVITPEEAAERGFSHTPSDNQEETLVLSAESYPANKKANVKTADEDIVQETIVLSSKDIFNTESTITPPHPDSGEIDLGATVVVSPARNSTRNPAVETGTGNASAKETDRKTRAATHQENKDILTETVVLRPKKEKK